MAMLTVALVASLAAGALWQQWRSVEIETAERSRVQSLWVLTGALDWARLILREDARSGGADHLAEPWAIPLEEARLSTFLATDKSNLPDDENSASQALVSEPALRAFAKLFETLGLAPGELTAVAENLRLALDTTALNANSPLLPQRVDQLVWLGLSPASLARLRPYIALLPVRTTVNLNTADATVLYASIPSLDMAQAQRLVSARQASHFRTLADVTAVTGELKAPLNPALHGVGSRFFEVRGRLRLGQTLIEEHSLVQRDALDVKTVWRDRGPPE